MLNSTREKKKIQNLTTEMEFKNSKSNHFPNDLIKKIENKNPSTKMNNKT